MAAKETFEHSTPALYDRFMGPLFFEPYARLLAKKAARFNPQEVLETAAGTGILSAALRRELPAANIIATDINPAMLEYAAERVGSDRLTFKQANAQELPFPDESFDLVVTQFGVMFFPDKVRAALEARRVLRPGGRYVVVAFDELDRNPVAQAAGEAVASLFAEHPRYMERGPFSYSDPLRMRDDLLAAGFTNVDVEALEAVAHVTAEDAAQGIVLGSPFRAEIERLGPGALTRAVALVKESLRQWDGKDAPMSALVAKATR